MRSIKKRKKNDPTGSEDNGYLTRLLNLGSRIRGKITAFVTWLGRGFLNAAPTSFKWQILLYQVQKETN